MASQLRDAALDVAERLRLPIFPVKPRSKIPLVRDWQRVATADLDTVSAWWGEYPSANIGMPTGKATGRIVIDLDAGGDDSWHELEASYSEAPATVEVITGGGGRHLHFARPTVPRLGNRVGLVPGVDVRCDGGLVVIPTSIHESGRKYVWEVAGHPEEIALAPAPAWLIALLYRRRERDLTYRQEGTIPTGRRNDTLTRLAGGMRRNGMGQAEILAALSVTNETRCQPPLPTAEIEAIARSIGRRDTAPPWALDPVRWAAGDDRLSTHERFVLASLAAQAGHDGRVIGGEWLRERTGLSRNSVSRAVIGLERYGWIKAIRKRRHPSIYWLQDA